MRMAVNVNVRVRERVGTGEREGQEGKRINSLFLSGQNTEHIYKLSQAPPPHFLYLFTGIHSDKLIMPVKVYHSSYRCLKECPCFSRVFSFLIPEDR